MQLMHIGVSTNNINIQTMDTKKYDELIYSDLTTIYGGNKMPKLENIWDFCGFLIKSHARSIMYTAEGGGNASNIGC